MSDMTGDDIRLEGNVIQRPFHSEILAWILEPKRLLGLIALVLVALVLISRSVLETLAFSVGLDF
ncbi:MAG: hypothetical protein ABGY43_00415, partial [bacterium]